MNLSSPAQDRRPYILAAGVILLCAGLRVHLAGMPLERDEGEYAYVAQRLLVGVPPFADTFTLKFPGIYVIYALILKWFGQTDTTIREVLILTNAASCAFLFGIVRKISSDRAAIWSAAAYAVLTLNSAVLGMTANAEHFILFFVLAGIFLLTHSTKLPWSFAGGLCFGLAVTMKQQGFFFLFLGAAWILFRARNAKSLVIYGLSALIPIGIMLFWMRKAGVWDSFIFWCFTYPRHYGSAWSASERLYFFLSQGGRLAAHFFTLLLAACAGGVIAWKKEREAGALILFALLCGAVAVTPGWIFRSHYFLFLMPGLAIAAGLALARVPAISLVALIVAAPLGWDHALYSATPKDAVRQLYPDNAFSETRELGLWLQRRLKPNETLAVLGSEPEIYFYAQHPGVIPYVYTYPLVENQPYAEGMQRHLMALLEKQPPDFIIHARIPKSWLVQRGAPTHLLEWIPTYLESHYIAERVIETGADRNIILYRRRQ